MDESSDLWESLRRWIEAETGMDLAGNRESRLRDAVARVLGHETRPRDLQQLLSQGLDQARFFEAVTGRLTIGESFFLRNEHHFRALREHVVPAILQDNRERRELRVWSAGCAGGEEPYSLAILLDQLIDPAESWNVSVLGTDLNPDFLQAARKAEYRPWSFRGTTIQNDPRYFERDGDTYRVIERLRRHVRFAHLNLVKDPFPSPMNGTLGLDLILFRNVAIYFRPEVTQAVIERLSSALRPGGWLLMGETEVGRVETPNLEVRRFPHATFHQRVLQPGRTPDDEPGIRPVLNWTLPPTATPRIVLPSPPEAPVWTPLPTRQRSARPRPRTARPPVRLAANVDHANWTAIAELAARRRFTDAELAINGIQPDRERLQIKLRFARELLALSEASRARRAVEEIVRDDPMLIEAWLLQASLAEEAGDLPAAEHAYRRALYLDRNCTIAHFHLGLLCQQEGDETGARRCLATVLRLSEACDPQQPVEYGDGVCYGRLRELAQLMSGTADG